MKGSITKSHPAYIKNFTTAHAQLLKTQPNGTYALYSLGKDRYALVIKANNKLIAFEYCELDTGKSIALIQQNFLYTLATIPQSIAELINNPKELLEITGFSLTANLNEKLDQSSELMSQLETYNQQGGVKNLSKMYKPNFASDHPIFGNLKKVLQVDRLRHDVKGVIAALHKDLGSSVFCTEVKEVVTKAIALMIKQGNRVDFPLKLFLTQLIDNMRAVQSRQPQKYNLQETCKTELMEEPGSLKLFEEGLDHFKESG